MGGTFGFYSKTPVDLHRPGLIRFLFNFLFCFYEVPLTVLDPLPGYGAQINFDMMSS